MDLLKKELERKKRALHQAKATVGAGGSSSSSHGATFYKASQLRQWEEEQREKEREQTQQEKRKLTQVSKGQEASSIPPVKKSKQDADSKKTSASSRNRSTQSPEAQVDKLSVDEVTHRLRSLGLAIRLFGECGASNDAARKARLRQALAQQKITLATLSEKDEFRLGQGHSIRNPFLEKDDSTNDAPASTAGATTSRIRIKTQEEKEETDKEIAAAKEEEEEDVSNDPHKRIYKYFKALLNQWEEDLTQRPDDVKRSVAGKNETKTVKQCKDYIRPLFKLCKKRTLEENIMNNLVKIIDYCEQGEFVKAHDAYIDLAIGRAAWPIGVTMVGIHARTGRSRIESQNVAHVMNSELQRKYLTSVKRLMSYAQKKRPDVDPSKKVLNL